MDLTATSIIAVYGAVLSTLGLGWNIYRDMTNRGRLKVHCYVGKIVGGFGSPDDRDYVIWSITNVGRQPVMVTMAGGKYAINHFIIHPRSLPKMLQPGEYVIEYSPDLQKLADGQVKQLYANDSHGKTHKAPRRDVRVVLKVLQKKGMAKAAA